MENKKSQLKQEDERAVSPVIGVILMVAITVILAAVIAAFVLDIGDTSQNPAAGFDINQDGENVSSVQIQTIDRLDSVEISGGDCVAAIDTDWGTNGVNDAPSVGDRITFDTDPATDSCERSDIVIIGTYDGNDAVLIG